MKRNLTFALALLALLLVGMPQGQAQRPGRGDAAAQTDTTSTDKPADKKKKGKSYSDIITDEAVSDEGLFTVHQIADKYYFEIPTDKLGKEILVVSRISGHVKGLNFGGAGMKSRPQQVVRWEKNGNNILLRYVTYDVVADADQPIAQSVKNNNFEPVINAFKIETYNDDSTAVVIEVSAMFTSEIPMIAALGEGEKRRFGIRNVDSKRSFIQHMKAFPQNVEVRHVLTYNGTQLPDNQLTGTLSIEMNQSFIELPEDPWQPRLYDDRVGYFSISQTDYGLDEQKAATRRYITRWRLDPKDPAAYARGELVEPKKPIVYYIDPATPEKWAPYIKQGVEDWQAAFESAGFKNAIIGKYAPTPEEDPDWSPEDVRYSVIRYISTDIQNAQGPHVHDPRTGEILESDIMWYHNVMNLLRNWFFIQTSAVNPAARMVKFDDALMGELIRFVAAHEVGHTLGLPHNMGSSVAYPVDSLRKAGFVQRMGVAPSIMDYARFNYVAQPEDEGAGLMPKVGPYDHWAITYGYRLLPGVTDPDVEKETLNKWILERAGNPVYRYGQQQRGVLDPSAQTEDVGGNAVEASDLGIANLKRIVDNLMDWGTTDGKDYSDLQELFGNVAGQYRRYMGHVTGNIGGVYEYDKTADEAGPVYTHVDREYQRSAVNFLNRQLFMTPSWMLNTDILSRIQSDGIMDLIRGLQVGTMRSLFNADRLKRMIENEALNGRAAYTAKELFDDTRRGIFSEVNTGSPIDPFRRNLQRAYIDQLGGMVLSTDADVHQTDSKALARATINRLASDISKNVKKQSDDVSRYHLEDLLVRIKMIQEGKKLAESGNSSANPFGSAILDTEVNGCWDNNLDFLKW